MNNNNYFNINSPVFRFIVAAILVSASSIVYAVALNMKDSTSGYEPSHSESLDDSSLINIVDENTIAASDLSDIEGRILNNIYTHHYNETGLIERTASVDKLTKTNNSKYTFNISFTPSKTKYSVAIDVVNIKEKNFSIEVK